ncbi:complement resistance protein TraT [Klebsiella pneumoniae]|uniref:complement resistance protein TraT n=1 Tax=Klebsiella pneumoniae TaxID=573 RepID=UPI003975CBCC
MAADAMVEDVNYTMITDVQIAERTKTQVQTDNVAVLRQEHPAQKCRQVLKRVISINTRLASSLTRIKLTSSS